MTFPSTLKRLRPCPMCGKAPANDYTPFCSKGCRDRDFLKWMGGDYGLPGPMLDEDALEAIVKDGEKNADSRLDSERED